MAANPRQPNGDPPICGSKSTSPEDLNCPFVYIVHAQLPVTINEERAKELDVLKKIRRVLPDHSKGSS
ncbi:Hypothetical predicted protein [Podarcis lilfordi]|uniref:Uncharacterized protein n=1 Tax=Podarcis lilfordi TaxID=74358 RepID=A0AA35KSS5_9SAUR|nr:Hypothetical predicted protein [Podarcis lilfordi]